MFPADDEVTALGRMVEAAAAELELDTDALVAATSLDAALSLAVGLAGLYALDHEANACDDAEQEYDALLVDRSVLEPAEVDELAVQVGLP